jgi:hypothetical protein
MGRANPYMDLNAKYGKLLLRCLWQSIQIRIQSNLSYVTLEGKSGIRSHKTGQAFLGVICMDVENVFVCVYVTYISISIYCTNKIYHLYSIQFIKTQCTPKFTNAVLFFWCWLKENEIFDVTLPSLFDKHKLLTRSCGGQMHGKKKV